MTSGRYGLVLREVGRLLTGGTVGALEAGPLLERFASNRDEAAFEALVSRHGPMVLGTCRRMLSDPHDVDDAFQATFLVLARKAGSIRDADRLGPWLHGVARRVAARSRALASRRKSVERPAFEEPAAESPDLLEGSEVRQAIDEELSRLPEKYRAPLVLCYLEGLTHDEAADALRWPVGTVRSRLAGARERLRVRLARRGFAPSAAVPALLPTGALSPALLSTTVRVATTAGNVPAHVLTLAKGALLAMTWNKLKMIAALGLMAGLTVGGAGVAAQHGGAGKAEAPAAEKSPMTLEQVQAEMKRIRAEEAAIEKKIKELQSEHAKAIAPLEKQLAGLNSRDFELSEAWKKRKEADASTAVDDRIKLLEKQLADQSALIQSLRGQGGRPLDKAASEAAQAPVVGDATPRNSQAAGKFEGPPNNPGPPPADAPPAAPGSTVLALPGNPALFAVIPAARDRVTMIDSVTQTRAILLLAGAATEITPVPAGFQWVTLKIKGRGIARTAVYDRIAREWSVHDLDGTATEVLPWPGPSTNGGNHSLIGFTETAPDIRRLIVFDGANKAWSEQELREPVKDKLKWAPQVGDTMVLYNIGRFSYAYSAFAKKWSALERKQEPTAPGDYAGQILDASRTMFKEGTLIHIYNARTGEWSHIDTKDDE